MPEFRNTITQNGVAVSLAGHTHSGGGIASGAAFPGGPATNDLYYRTDLGVLCQWSGSYWFGPREPLPMSPWMAAPPFTVSGDTFHIYPGGISFVVSSVKFFCNVATSNASNYWTIVLSMDGVNTICTANTASGSGFITLYPSFSGAIRTTSSYINIYGTKTGNPSGIYLSPAIEIRRYYA
jgi:hypothetical protein